MTGITKIFETIYFNKIKFFDKEYLQKETEQHYAIVHNICVDLWLQNKIEIKNYYIDSEYIYLSISNKNSTGSIKIDYDNKKYYRKYRKNKLKRILNETI
ncbi:MAG: hypothetical protein HPY57_14640 [Ignavibacteria bacterium]|nr:hypothetical protein [Ignavibacteria bacterium]